MKNVKDADKICTSRVSLRIFPILFIPAKLFNYGHFFGRSRPFYVKKMNEVSLMFVACTIFCLSTKIMLAASSGMMLNFERWLFIWASDSQP